jgi:hypothetical protein
MLVHELKKGGTFGPNSHTQMPFKINNRSSIQVPEMKKGEPSDRIGKRKCRSAVKTGPEHASS